MSYHNYDVTKLVEISKSDPSLITLEATVITGFENIAMEECQEKCKPSHFCRAKGRIFFNIPIEKFSNAMKLRAVDNIFLINNALGVIELKKDKEQDLELIKSLVDRVDWNGTLSIWAKLTEFKGILFPKEAGDSVGVIVEGLQKTNLQETVCSSGLKNGKEPEHSIKDKKGQELVACISDKLGTSSETNIKSENTEIIVSNTNDVNQLSDFENNKLEKEETKLDNLKTNDGNTHLQINEKTPNVVITTPTDCDNNKVEELNCVNTVLKQASDPETLGLGKGGARTRVDSTSSNDSFYSVEEINVEATGDTVAAQKKQSLTDGIIKVNSTKNVDKKKKNKNQNVDPNILKFRVTCNRTGDHSFSSMEAACDFGGTLQDKFNWTVDLEKFNLNVIININSDRCYICSAITHRSLHRRNISHFGYTTLRSTMCYNLLRIAEPARGEIIIDPLCGGGSIPIEGALGFPNTFHICGDICEKAVKRTGANISHLSKNQPLLVDPVRWTASSLPLKDQCIDVFVTDLPFGKRSGKKADNLQLYRLVLEELARVIRCGTGRAVVLTNDKNALIKALAGNNHTYWRQIKAFGVNQGGLFSTVFLLLRTSKPFIL